MNTAYVQFLIVPDYNNRVQNKNIYMYNICWMFSQVFSTYFHRLSVVYYRVDFLYLIFDVIATGFLIFRYHFCQIFIKNRKSENRDLYEEWRPWHVKYSLTSTAPFINSSHGQSLIASLLLAPECISPSRFIVYCFPHRMFIGGRQLMH